MLWNAVIVTSAIAVASVVSKCSLTNASHGARHHAHDLMRKAQHSLETAAHTTTSPTLQLQHASAAAAYLVAARMLVSDDELEYMFSMDVSLMAKRLEALLSSARAAATTTTA